VRSGARKPPTPSVGSPPVRGPKGKGRQSRPPARGVAAKSNFLSLKGVS